ncbi:MAG: HTTM domain-containing protein [Halohasta sp.]
MDTDDASTHADRSPTGQFAERVEPVWRRIRARFAVDARSLAAFRIALGLTLLIDLVHRAGSMELFYTDSGMYPVAAYEATYDQYTGLSLHALSGDLWLQQLLFVVAALFAIAYMLGYRTRLVGFVSLVLLLSLQARNPAVLNGGDRLLRVLLIVAQVAPLGERWSVDALRRGRARSTVASFGTAALLIQPLLVFSSNAILKHEGETWYAGEALDIAFHNDVMTILVGNHLAEFPALLTVLNYAWVSLLAGSVLFLFVPTGRLRALAALAYMGAFAGMLVTMTIGVFPLALIVSVTPYLTAPFWDAIARRIPDGWRDRLSTAERLGPLDPSRLLDRPPIEDRLLAALRARGHGSTASFAVSYAHSIMTILGLLMVVWMVSFAAVDVYEYDLPDEVDSPHLDQQSWGLYAPDPSEGYEWFVLKAGAGNDRETVDLEGTAASPDRPPDAAATYETFRHRKFMQSVRSSGDYDPPGTIAESYAEWACGQVAERGDPVEEVTLYQIYQPSPLDGEFESTSHETVIEYECSSG